MKKKELLKRLSAISMAAMMAVTAVPANTFAADIEFSDGEAETAEAQEDSADISVEEDTGSAEAQTEDFQAEEPSEEAVTVNEENADFSADAEDALFSDGAEAVGDAVGDAKVAADEYLKNNYVDNNKIITSGGAGVVKSQDGLSYSVGLKIPTSGSKISSLRFKTESSSSNYRVGWYINSDCPWVNIGTKKPANLGSLSINRPTAEQGAQSFQATLRLFSADTSTDVINDEAQAATAALATQEFTIIIEAAEPNYTMRINVVDEEGNLIPDAIVTLEKNWNAVAPKADGSYDMEKGAGYSLTVKKDGYNDYTESYFTFNPTEVNTVKTVTLKKIVTRNIRFNVTDKSGNPVNSAKVSVKKGYYSTVNPESDGSYNLIDGTSYNYTVEAPNYKTASSSFTPSGDQTIDIQLEKNITDYNVKFNPVDNDGKAIENASIKVTYEEEDPWDEDETETIELKANEDGSYTMKKGVTYTYTVKASDYKDVTATYTPSGDDENVSIDVKMVSSIDPADVETVNAIKEKFDKEVGTLRPDFASCKNICDLVKTKIEALGMDTTGVTVSVKSSDDSDTVATDGTIHYYAQAPNSFTAVNSKNINLVFVFEKNGAKAETAESRATIGWDRDYFNTQMAADQENLTWDKIKGSNTDAAEVTSNLTLPQCMSSSVNTAWSKITWTSSDESVISFKDTGWGSLIDAKEGVVIPQQEDKEVTLTATFNANDRLLNGYVEKVSDFATLTKEFKVTVKGTGISKPTEKELQAILDQYYTADKITDSNTQGAVDLENCTSDLQLPRYTRITDANGENVFNNREITVTSDNAAITVNGYRAAVDRFASNDDINANLIVTFTRDGVTAIKKIPVTVKAITEAEVQDQLNLMELAKVHYFDGINDGQYADKDSITGNLHPFQEMILGEDGNPKWIYNFDDKTGKGIIPDDQFTDPWEMEGAGYNKFKSSNNAVVGHENLVVTRRETDTQITISSVLSSELYREAAAKHPDNAVLQKLYKQPVSVTVTIKGTKSAAEGLQKLISEAQTLLDGMTEGTEAGQYPEGTKATLKEAIDTATAVLNKENVTEEELSEATQALQKAVDTAKDAQNTAVAEVKIRVNMANQPASLRDLTVTAKDAAAYGYEKPEAMKNQVTVVDALYTLHKAMYGEAFDADPSRYLNVGTNGWINTVFEDTTGNVGYYVNNEYPVDETGMGTVANTTVLHSGDEFSIYLLADTTSWSDEYLYFKDVPTEICAGKEFQAVLYGRNMMSAGASAEAGCTVELKNLDTNETAEFVTDADGVASLKADKAGNYQLTVTKTPYTYFVAPLAQFEAKEHVFDEGKVTKEPTCAEAGEKTYTCTVCGTTKTEEIAKTNKHTYDKGVVTKKATYTATGVKTYTCTVCGATKTETIPKLKHTPKYVWKTVSKATVFQPEKQVGYCVYCKHTQTRYHGSKLKATIKLNTTAITLQRKQATRMVRVSMANGDSVKSWASTNTKIVTVDRNGLIRAQNRNGSAKIIVTLKSGKRATLNVKVQSGKVTTTKISGLKSSMTLKKGQKTTLKPVISPLTSTDKVTYATSNKNIAAVSSTGIITAKKKGTAKITVRSGKKSYVIKVTVK